MAIAEQRPNFISEQEFNKQAGRMPTDPQLDSLGDSQADMNREFQIGLDYRPEEDVSAAEESSDIPVFDLGLSGSGESFSREEVSSPEDRLPENAKIVHGGSPTSRKTTDDDEPDIL